MGAVAFAVAAAGLTFAAAVFRSRDQPRPTSTVTNGKIAFSGFDGDTWQIYAVERDGSQLVQLSRVSESEVAMDPAWSPEGARIAFVVQGSEKDGTTGRADIWLMNADGSNVRPLTDGTGSNWSPAWSPSGEQIAFARGGDIYVVDPDGSRVTRLTDDVAEDGMPAWSPDGSRIVFQRNEDPGADLYVINADGTGLTRLTSAPGFEGEPAWSPDGSRIAFTAWTVDATQLGRIYVMNADGTGTERLTDGPGWAQAAAWSPDGTRIAFISPPVGSQHEAIFVMNADGTGLHQITGLPREATSPGWQPVIETEPEPSPAPPSVSSAKANGLIYFRVGGGDGPSFIYEIQPDGTGEQPVFDSQPPHASEVSWSPDGKRIAYADHVVGFEGIYVSNPDGSDAVRLTSGVNDAMPSWSPHGTTIVFAGTDPEAKRCEPGFPVGCHTDIFVMNADGTGVTRLTGDPEPEFQPVWSPDGKWIAFVRGNQTGIYVMNGEGSDVHEVASTPDGSDFSPSWSPDGRRLVYSSIRNEDWGIFAVDLENPGEIQIVFGRGYYDDPVWSPDGRIIAFVGNLDGAPANALYVMDADGSAITRFSTSELDRYGVVGDIAWQPLQVEQASPSPTEPLPTPTVSDPIPIESSPGAVSSVTYGFGSVWIASFDGSQEGWITRLDPTTGEKLAHISTGDVFPTWEIEGGGLTVGDGGLWLAGAAPAREDVMPVRRVQRDPRNDGVRGGVDLGDEHPGRTVIGDRERQRPNTIFVDCDVGPGSRAEIDRRLNRVRVGIDPEQERVHAAGLPTPMTAQVTGRVPLGTYAAMAGVGSDLWAADGHSIMQLDPATGDVRETWQVLNTGDVLAASQGEAGLWFLGPASRSAIYRFDPKTGHVDVSVELLRDTTPVAIAVAPESVWVLNYEGTATRVALT